MKNGNNHNALLDKTEIPDTYVLLAKKISQRENLQNETELLCKIIRACAENNSPDRQTELIRRELGALFDDKKRKTTND